MSGELNIKRKPMPSNNFPEFIEMSLCSDPLKSFYASLGLGLLEILVRGKVCQKYTCGLEKVFREIVEQAEIFAESRQLQLIFEIFKNLFQLMASEEYSRPQLMKWLDAYMIENLENSVEAVVVGMKAIICVLLGNSTFLQNKIFGDSPLDTQNIMIIAEAICVRFPVNIKIIRPGNEEVYKRPKGGIFPVVTLFQSPPNTYSLLYHKEVLIFDKSDKTAWDLFRPPFVIDTSASQEFEEKKIGKNNENLNIQLKPIGTTEIKQNYNTVEEGKKSQMREEIIFPNNGFNQINQMDFKIAEKSLQVNNPISQNVPIQQKVVSGQPIPKPQNNLNISVNDQKKDITLNPPFPKIPNIEPKDQSGNVKNFQKDINLEPGKVEIPVAKKDFPGVPQADSPKIMGFQDGIPKDPKKPVAPVLNMLENNPRNGIFPGAQAPLFPNLDQSKANETNLKQIFEVQKEDNFAKPPERQSGIGGNLNMVVNLAPKGSIQAPGNNPNMHLNYLSQASHLNPGIPGNLPGPSSGIQVASKINPISNYQGIQVLPVNKPLPNGKKTVQDFSFSNQPSKAPEKYNPEANKNEGIPPMSSIVNIFPKVGIQNPPFPNPSEQSGIYNQLHKQSSEPSMLDRKRFSDSPNRQPQPKYDPNLLNLIRSFSEIIINQRLQSASLAMAIEKAVQNDPEIANISGISNLLEFKATQFPNPKIQQFLCKVCNLPKDFEEFTSITCGELECSVCSKCRINSQFQGCTLCGRSYSNQEINIIKMLKDSFN